MPATIKTIPDDHRKKIRRFGGDTSDPALIAEYCKWANRWVNGTGHASLSDDRLMSIADVAQKADAGPRFVPNGGADMEPGPKKKARMEREARISAAEALAAATSQGEQAAKTESTGGTL